jgi:glycogen synthase kinase 3 beta
MAETGSDPSSTTAPAASTSTEAKTAGVAKATPNYTPIRVIDKGSFGTVFEARVDGSPDGRTVAIKKVLQDPRYKNRELQIMKLLNNSYVCCMENHFLATGKKKDQVFLNLVLQYVES